MNERTIFLNALEIPEPAQRDAYVEQACAGDAALRQNVAALLKSHDESSGFLEQPIIDHLTTSAYGGETPGEPEVTDGGRGKPGEDDATQAESNHLPDHDLTFLAAPARPGFLGRLGPYEIQAVIGKGGFGIVLKAFDERLHRVVAIKVLSPAYAANGAARKRFIREARAAAAVKNEHVVGIYDVQEDAQPPYLVMEYIEGVSLQEKLDKVGTLGIKEVLRIGMQIAEGLTAAHKQGLVHRDIKPANILLENGVERVKITDFGLARAVDDASVTQSGVVAGTPMYMSPEQAEGLPIDHRSDLFSLGTVLYAMCTGHPPFRASGTHAVLKRVIDASPRPIREVNSEVPDWLCVIIAKLHAKNPADRFQTAREVAELFGQSLADVQAGRAIERAGRISDGPLASVAHASSPSPPKRGVASWLGSGVIAVAAVFLIYWLIPTWWLGSGEVELQSNDAQVEITVAAQDGSNPRTLAGNGTIELPAGFYYLEVRCASENLIDLITVTDWAYQKRAFPEGVKRDKITLRIDKGQTTYIDVRTKPKEAQPEPGWVQLFNGKDLTGWKPVGNPQVKDGTIDLSSDASVDTLKTLPAEFELQMEVKLTAGSGVIRFGAEPRQPQTNPPPPKDGWSITLQNLGDRFHADVSARSPHRTEGPATSLSYTNNAIIDKWFKLKIVAKSNRIRLRINDGDTDAVFAELKPGVLSLESLLPLNHIAFRNIKIKEPPPETFEWVQLFNGKDTNGWVDSDKSKWDVVDGALVPAKGGAIHTKAQYRVTELRLEYKIIGNGPGVNTHGTVHWQVPSKEGKLDLPYAPILKLLRNGEMDFSIQGPKEFVGGRAGAGGAPAKDGWHDLHIACTESKIEIAQNGKLCVTQLSQAQKPGHIRLTSQGLGLHFRNIKIKELPPEEPGWVQLFNGKDLTGWKYHPKHPGEWTVKDGILTSGGKEGNYLYTVRDDYADFHLRAEVQLEKGFSSAIFFRTGFGSTWEDSKMQPGLDGHNALISRPFDDNPTGSLRVTGLPFSVAEKGIVDAKEWFVLDLIAKGNRIESLVNGKPAATLVDKRKKRRFEKGHIALQMLNPDVVVRYRKIEIKEPPPEEPGWVQLFNGNDTDGWNIRNFKDGKWAVDFGVLKGTAKAKKPYDLQSVRSDYENFHFRAKAQIKAGGHGTIFFRIRDSAAWKGFAVKLDHLTAGDLQISTYSMLNTNRMLSEKRRDIHASLWFELEVIANGPRIELILDGKSIAVHTFTAEEMAQHDANGSIILMIDDPYSVFSLSKIEIKELPRTPQAPPTIAP